jgi:hypothetical protein
MLGLSFDYAFLPTFSTRGGILVAWRSGIWVASHVRHANNTLSLFISLVGPPPQWYLTTVYDNDTVGRLPPRNLQHTCRSLRPMANLWGL